jgi:hypothetical protein
LVVESWRRAAAVALISSAGWTVTPQRPPRQPFVAVGVMDDRPADGRRYQLEELKKLRFNVVARRDDAVVPGFRVETIPTPSAPAVLIPGGSLYVLPVEVTTPGARVRRDAWVAIGRAFRGVLFDDWARLQQNPEALEAAATFADIVTRNANLFAPLSGSSRTVRASAATPEIFARFVESSDAIVLVAANNTGSEQRVTLKFDPDLPEAVWQNMETGGAVNFVAGPDGPTYTRTFLPHDVVVLTIRKQYK